MGPLTPTGSRVRFFFVVLLTAGLGYGQSSALRCTVSAVPTQVRSEGLAERLGDIVIQCSGGTAGPISTNLSVFLAGNITNRLTSDNAATTTTASVSIDTGSGAVPAGVTGRITGGMIEFAGITFTAPASGGFSLRVSNLRAAITQQPVLASIASSLPLTNNPTIAALPSRGLAAFVPAGGIRCVASPLPSSISLSSLFSKGTRFASTRVTEGFAGAFQNRDTTADTGTRILVRYSNIPAGARIFIPEVIAGSSAVEPTSGGDLGLPQSGGKYTPGSGSLLLSRVIGADANGSGGFPSFTPGPPGSSTVSFNSATEVSSVNGTATAVYEVVDANGHLQESAQFPTFLAIAAINQEAIVKEEVFLAPLSSTVTASANAPVPRFAPVAPQRDCDILGDCDSSFFPRLVVTAPQLRFTSIAGGAAAQPPGHIPLRNEGGGVMSWAASVTFKSGAGWLELDPVSGINNASITAWIKPQNLAPGTYEATIVIDGGPVAGSKSLPVLLTVSALPALPAPPPVQPALPSVVVTSVTNAANFLPGPLVPGSLATLKGTNFSGGSVVVTFDGVPAKILFFNSGQINLQVPAALAGKTSAQMIVTVDGSASQPQSVGIAPAAPAVFQNGVLNQDSSANTITTPAKAGSVIQIFLTGLPPGGSGVSVKIHDRENLVPLFAGEAPGVSGLGQVNVTIPDDLPAMTTAFQVCAAVDAGQKVCSHPVELALTR